MAHTLFERLQETPEGKRSLQQERTILDLTERICEVMDRENVTRSELARRLGKTKGYVTQLLDGRANMTARTMSDILLALDHDIRFHCVPHHGAARASERAESVPSESGGMWEMFQCCWREEDRPLAWADYQDGALAS